MTSRVHPRLALDNQRDTTHDTPPDPPRFHHAGGSGLIGTRQRVALDGNYTADPSAAYGRSVLAPGRAP
jgi:hypothetical protein